MHTINVYIEKLNKHEFKLQILWYRKQILNHLTKVMKIYIIDTKAFKSCNEIFQGISGKKVN